MHQTYNAINSQHAVQPTRPSWGGQGGVGMYYYSARYYAPPTFISRDPMFEKYPSISPYTYCANNPVLLVDPDGEQIWIAFYVKNDEGKYQRQKVQYKNGKLYKKNGNEYTGGNKYATKVLEDLNQLANDNDVLKSRIHDLETSKNKHTIQMPHFKQFNQTKADAKKCIKGIPTGSTVTYDPTNRKTKTGNERSPRASLAHELLGHSWDADQGKTDYNLVGKNKLPMFEINAVRIENLVRLKTGDPKRTTSGENTEIPTEILDKPF